MVRTYMAVFGHFQIRNQGLDLFWKLTKYEVPNTAYSFRLQARPFRVRFRKALGNRRIFLS